MTNFSGSKKNSCRSYYRGYFSKDNKFKFNSKAVSEALGTIFLLGISMSLVGLVYYWVDSLPDPQDTLMVDLNASWDSVNGEYFIFIEHVGGDRIDAYIIEIFVKIDGIVQGRYPLYKSTQPAFDNDLWEVGETWSQNIHSLHDWNLSLPSVLIEVRNIDRHRIILSENVQLGGGLGNLPDMTVTEEDISFQFENSTLSRNEWVNISARIHNIGSSDAVNVIVRFFDGSELISFDPKDYSYIASLPSDTYKTVWSNWTPLFSGARDIHVKVYTLQMEEDYSNNYASKTLEVDPIIPTVTGPNLELENILFSPETPTHGDWVTITVLVKNIGDDAIPNGTTFNLTLWDDNGYILIKDKFYYSEMVLESNLTVLETLQPAFTREALTTHGGITTIYATISANITESKYEDNRLYKRIQILPTILLVDDDGLFGHYSREDASSYMDTALQLAVGSGQFEIFPVKGTDGPKYSSGEKPLRDYDIVIWMTGYQTLNTLSTSDQTAIEEYLNNQGKLWLISMNVLQNIGLNPFVFNYLGVNGYNTTKTPELLYGVEGENLTQGMELNTSNIIKAKDNGVNLILRDSEPSNHMIDNILGNDGYFGKNGSMSLKYYNASKKFKVVFSSFEFAGINNMDHRNNLTIQILKWFGWELKLGTDLAISSKGFDNYNPKFMDWITITAKVRNNGPRDLALVRVDFFIIDSNGVERLVPEYPGVELVDNPRIVPIDSGEEKTLEKKWLAISVGFQTFRVVVDLEDEIEEVSEENNDDFYSPLFVTQLFIGYTILVVDDDNSTNNNGTFDNATNDITTALTELGYIFDLYVTAGGSNPGTGPNITVMKHYNTVIWCTGFDNNHTLLDRDIGNITYYLTQTNFTEANFLGEIKFNLWLMGQGILDDLGGAGTDITPSASSFLGKYLGVKMYSTINPRLPGFLDGVYRDNVTHGISYPMIDSALDKTDTITPVTNATGIFWHDSEHTKYNALKYDAIKYDLLFMPWVCSLIDDSSTTQYVNESYKSELSYLILRLFSYPDVRFELKTSAIDIKLSNYNPSLGNSYIIKSNVYNLGGNDTNAIVRFIDGDTIINTKSVFVAANGNSSTEVIWSPLFAGFRDIRVSIDPGHDTDEIFDHLNNNATRPGQPVYFFYDDMENGTSNWDHESTIVFINGESPLDFMDNPVDSNVDSTWNENLTVGFDVNSTAYHSYSTSYYTIEPPGYAYMGNVLLALIIDDSASMTGRTDANNNTWLSMAKNASKYMISQLSDKSNITIWHFKGNNEEKALSFTGLEGTGRATVNSAIDNLNNPSGTTILWDSIGEAYRSVKSAMSSNPTLSPVVIVLSDGMDLQASDRSGLKLINAKNKIEGGSNLWSPWHEVYIDNDTSKGYKSVKYDIHYGKYTIDWVNASNSTYWLEAMGAGGSMERTRRGLLNSDVPIYTIGLGLEHHPQPNEPVMVNWPGDETADNVNASCIDTTPFCVESGTLEYNLWRIATTSNGTYFYSPTSDDLHSIFGEIASQLGAILSRSAPASRAPARSRASVNVFLDSFELGFTSAPWIGDVGWVAKDDTKKAHTGDFLAYFKGNKVDWKLTLNKDLDLTGYENVSLKFWQFTKNAQAGDSFHIDVSNNSGTNWTTVKTWSDTVLGSKTYIQWGIDLTDYNYSSTFRFRFRLTTSNNKFEWFIDDVEIWGTKPGGGSEDPPEDPPDEIPEVFYFRADRNLTTNAFSLVNVTSARVSFYQKYNLKNGLNGVVVMVGTPKGSGNNWSFEYVRPTQPYTSNYLVSETKRDDYGNVMRWCWNGISGNGRYKWDFVEIDLTNWTGLDQVRVKVCFLWAAPGNGGGYLLDDFKITVTRNESQALTDRTVDQWGLTDSNSHSGKYCWWNRNITTNHLSGGLDNSLYSRPIDLTNARNATLSAYLKFNINQAAGRPPDGFRVEISSDNGVTWKAINMGVRAAWGVSTNGSDADDGVSNDGKSYSGLDKYGADTKTDGWVEAGTLTRLNTELSGWAGDVIILRFRVVTATDDNIYFGNKHYEWKTPSNNAYGLLIDDIIIIGTSLLG